MKPFLALFRAGPSSLHPHAVARLEKQNFDYALSWFGDAPPNAPGAAFVHLQKGAKWPGLAQTLAAFDSRIAQYDYVWLPDDDLLCEPELVSRMFSICADLQLDLAQPALTPQSHFVHPITLQHSAFQLRFTNFVEIMAPVLSRAMLARVRPTLDGQISGWGLDSVWPQLSTLGRVAVIDETPVTHTRPIGGPNYALSQQAGVSPLAESWVVAASHFFDKPMDAMLNLGGLLQNGDALCLSEQPADIEALLQALFHSCATLRLSATQLTRYLGLHLDFARGGGSWPTGYGRAAIKIALEQAQAGVAMKFNRPVDARAPSNANANSPAPAQAQAQNAAPAQLRTPALTQAVAPMPAASPASAAAVSPLEQELRRALEVSERLRGQLSLREADLSDLQARHAAVLADRDSQRELLDQIAERLAAAHRACQTPGAIAALAREPLRREAAEALDRPIPLRAGAAH
jgi:hypothetical protein